MCCGSPERTGDAVTGGRSGGPFGEGDGAGRGERTGDAVTGGRSGGPFGEGDGAQRGGEPVSDAPRRSFALGAAALGFGLSGFFDGVLLHQILQWHHLLGALGGDLRFQVAADGWFHAAMYAVALFGLWRLWRARAALAWPGAGAAVAGWGFVGFGLWHAVDAVGSHWLLGIHRIRTDAASPLPWDLGWLAAFGLLPLALGASLLRRPGASPAGPAAAALALAAAGMGAWAAAPPPGGAALTVAFAPSVPAARAHALAAGAGAAVVWSDAAGGVHVVADPVPGAAARLLRAGAIYAGGTGLPGGCLAWREG